MDNAFIREKIKLKTTWNDSQLDLELQKEIDNLSELIDSDGAIVIVAKNNGVDLKNLSEPDPFEEVEVLEDSLFAEELPFPEEITETLEADPFADDPFADDPNIVQEDPSMPILSEVQELRLKYENKISLPSYCPYTSPEVKACFIKWIATAKIRDEIGENHKDYWSLGTTLKIQKEALDFAIDSERFQMMSKNDAVKLEQTKLLIQSNAMVSSKIDMFNTTVSQFIEHLQNAEIKDEDQH